MRNKLLLLVMTCIVFASFQTEAQQDAQYTQYMYNTLSINPAYAGSRETFSALLLYRSQWVGLNGAPDTQTLNLHSPIGASKKVGLGLSVVNDNIGPTHETYFDAAFSYTINTSDIGKLSFGIKGGGHLLDVNYDELTPFNGGDALLENNIKNKFSPNVGIGLYYHSANKWYLGASAPNLLETQHFDANALSVAKERINYYLIGGYVFDLNSDLKFKPSFLLKAVEGAPLQADLSFNGLIKEKFIMGLAYRWSAAVSGLLGYQINDGLMLGLAYDRETTDLGKTKFERGSFELFLRYELFDSPKILSPRFF